MKSTNTNIQHSIFHNVNVLRTVVCLIAAAITVLTLPAIAKGQYFLPEASATSNGYDYSYGNPAQPQTLQPLNPLYQSGAQSSQNPAPDRVFLENNAPNPQPVGTSSSAPSAASSTRPNAAYPSTYGGMPVTSPPSYANEYNNGYGNGGYGNMGSPQPVPQSVAPNTTVPQVMPVPNANAMQPVPQIGGNFQPLAPQLSGNMPIQSERTRLAESDPVFNGEVEGLLNQMQNTDSALPMQTFRTGSPDMIPNGIENLRPIEAEQSAGQMQTQIRDTPSTGGSSPQLFGAGTERSLADMDDESFDFSAIMQQQRQAGDGFAFHDGDTISRQNHPLAVAEDLKNVSGGRLVDLSNRQAGDSDVEDLPVLEVVIEGNGKIPQHTIRNMIKTMPGEPFRLQTVQEDARTLNQTGSFFSVTPRYQRKADGVIVRFELVERPIFHSVQFVGNRKIRKSILTEQVGIKKGDPVDVAMVLQGREKLKEFYRSEGFERASVTIASGDRIDDRNVVYIVNEGTKQRVLKTELEGATFVSGTRLKTYIESKPGILYFIGGEFSREKLDADVEKLLDFYQRHGFFNIQIDRKFEEGNGYWGLSEPGSWIRIKFIVSEGPRFKINNIKFVGNKLFSDEELAKDFKLKPGNHYLQTALVLDEASIGRKYGDKGHLLTKVKGHVRLIADKPGEIDITYSIRESPQIVASQITIDIVGDAAHTRTSTLLKHLALSNIKPGKVVKSNMIRNAENSLARAQFLNSNPSEGQTPRIVIEAENGEFSDEEDEELLDRELQEIEEMIMRGQSPDGRSYRETSSGLHPRDWRRILQRSGLGPHPAFPEPEAEYRVGYPQSYDDGYGYDGSTSLIAPSATTSQNSMQNPAVGVQQGSYTIPEQYQGYQTTTNGSTNGMTGTPYSSTVQAGSVPSLPVSTNNVSSTGSAFGFFGQNDPEPYNAGTNGNLVAPSATYSGDQYGMSQSTTSGSLPGTVGMVDNQVIPATTNPTDYYGDNGYGSITQASGLFPSPGTYNDFGAPGSITRPSTGAFDEYARAKVTLRAMEGKTGNMTMSVGVNSDSGLVGRFAIEERNFDWRKLPTNPWTLAGWRNAFRGAGQRFLIEAMPGENYQRYQVSFQEPFLWNTRFSLGLNGSYYTRYYDEWRERRTGGGVTIGRSWTDRFSTALSFNGANVKVYDPIAAIPDLTAVLGNNAQYAFGISGTYDTRDNAMMPTEGGTLTVNAEQVLGTSKFLRGGYDARRYYALHRRGDGSGAWVLGLRSAANVTESSTPIYERYYAGGFSTIRGFEYRGVTPLWNGYGIGGNFEFYNSIELCFPISADDNFRGVFFVDTGTVEKSISNWESEYRVAPGFGIRLNIPMMGPVPIAFDFAFPINKQTGDVSQMFSFNMGLVR